MENVITRAKQLSKIKDLKIISQFTMDGNTLILTVKDFNENISKKFILGEIQQKFYSAKNNEFSFEHHDLIQDVITDCYRKGLIVSGMEIVDRYKVILEKLNELV